MYSNYLLNVSLLYKQRIRKCDKLTLSYFIYIFPRLVENPDLDTFETLVNVLRFVIEDPSITSTIKFRKQIKIILKKKWCFYY